MFNLSWHIVVGRYKLLMLDSVTITRSVEQLSDTAEIVLPGSCFNKAIEIEDKIKRGDAVSIMLGYDDKMELEFEGFLDRIATDDGSLKLQCLDGLFKFKEAIPDKEFTNPALKDILNYILPVGYTVNCDYSFKYDKFVIRNWTRYDALKKIQEETKANIYMKGSVLHIHPKYVETYGTEKYSFQHNIEKSELEYKNAEDRPFESIVEGKGKDGKIIKETAGKKGGDSVTIKIEGVSDRATLKKMAEEQLKAKSYTGYSGSFTGWLIPFCDAGYKIELKDEDYEFKNGTYYVTEVVTKMSKAGGERTIKLGRKL